MADVQINTPGPSAPVVVPVERASNGGSATVIAIILALVLAVALVWYFVGYRPTSSATTAPSNPGATINVNVPPVNVNVAPAPVSGASNAPTKPAPAAAP
jgi:hypothetical protein